MFGSKIAPILPTDSLRYGTIKPSTVILGIDLFTASVGYQ